MLDLVATPDERNVTQRALFNFFNHFLALFNKPLHGRTLHPLELDAEDFDNLVDAFDLALRLFKVRFECSGEVWGG